VVFSAGFKFPAKMLILAFFTAVVNVVIYHSLFFINLAPGPIPNTLYIIVWYLVFFIVYIGIIGTIMKTFIPGSSHHVPMELDHKQESRMEPKLKDPAETLEEDVFKAIRQDNHVATTWKSTRIKDINAVAPIYKYHWEKVRFGGRPIPALHRVDDDVPTAATMQTKMKNVNMMAHLFKYHWGHGPYDAKTNIVSVYPRDLVRVSPRDKEEINDPKTSKFILVLPSKAILALPPALIEHQD